jgi:hypothetical protein
MKINGKMYTMPFGPSVVLIRSPTAIAPAKED